MTFTGFPSRPQSTPIPNVFFSDLLPKLTDPASLAVTLYAFAAVSRTKGFPRYIRAADLDDETGLSEFLRNAGAERDAIARGLNTACDLGVLLPLPVEIDGRATTLYFLNAPADRRGLEAVRSGSVALGRVMPAAPQTGGRSSIFALYESLVGSMTPLVVDELTEAERLYPPEWLERAFREAAAQNVRSWRYVSRILERWAIEGPDHAKIEGDPAEDRYYGGKYGRILKQRLKP